MSLRLGVVVLWSLLACGNMKVKKGEPQTAREKMAAEQKASKPDPDDSGAGKKWNAWRYQGDRKDCFFLAGRKCFKTEKAACAAAKCGAAGCETEGAGPATIKCVKQAKG